MISTLTQKIASALDALLPGLRADGADLEVLSVAADGSVRLRLVGALSQCPMARATIEAAIEGKLCAHLREVVRVKVEQ